MKTLIIFNLIPEDTIRAIVDLSEDEFQMFSKANGYIINTSEYNEEKAAIVNLVNNALCSDPTCLKYCDTDLQKQYFMKWSGDLEDKDNLITDLSSVDKLLTFGFYL